MEHNDIRHKLSEYLEASISAKEKTEIENHLKTCQQCSDALQELRKTIEHIKTVEEIDPPAWMTQKIMSTVRAEAGKKKTVFQRLFYPLMVKLPVQAIAVLFLAVTGFYIYQNIQQASRISEAPTHEFAARNEESSTGTAQDKLAKADVPVVRSKKVQQSPEYKALDMKLEYEKPAKPTPQNQAAAPATSPAKPAEKSPLVKNEVTSEKRAVAPQPAALSREQAESSAGAELQSEGEQGSAAVKRKFNGAAADDGASSTISITLSVKDIETAAEKTEAMIRQFEGTIISMTRLDAKRKYIISLSSHRANDLIEKLKLVGDMKEKNLPLEPREGRMVFSIELDRKRTPAEAE